MHFCCSYSKRPSQKMILHRQWCDSRQNMRMRSNDCIVMNCHVFCLCCIIWQFSPIHASQHAVGQEQLKKQHCVTISQFVITLFFLNFSILFSNLSDRLAECKPVSMHIISIHLFRLFCNLLFNAKRFILTIFQSDKQEFFLIYLTQISECINNATFNNFIFLIYFQWWL